MFEYVQENWETHDPDGLLTSLSVEEASNKVHPREDILQCKNRKTGVVVDLGFYCEEWVVNVIGSAGWDQPLVEKRFTSFANAITSTISLLNEYNA